MRCPAFDKRHLAVSIASAYLIAAAAVAHILTQSVNTGTLAQPPLCIHAPFAGISQAVVLGQPLHTNRFLACALNCTLRVVALPDANQSSLSMANVYHITAPEQTDSISIRTLLEASLFLSFLDALRSIAPNTRALILDNSAIVEPDPRWVKLHAIARGMRFDVMRLEPCSGKVETTDGPLQITRCTHRCFNPEAPASAIVSYSGAVKMLKWAEREHQAYPIAWFYGLVRMMDPSFELLCVNGLNAHSEQEWKRTKKGML